MTGSILIVEDDADIAELMDLYLQREGFVTQVVGSGETADEALRTGRWDLVLLDINLPGIDGFEVLQRIRRASDTPVILVTARQEEMDAVFGLGAGADEYVTKPFSPRVLVARVRALLRRVGSSNSSGPGDAGDIAGSTVVRLGEIEVHPETSQVFRNGSEIALAPREFAVLRFLIERDGRPSLPAEIFNTVWGNDYGDLSSVAIHIQRLRRKLEPDPSNPRYIVTRHGYGYAAIADRPDQTDARHGPSESGERQ